MNDELEMVIGQLAVDAAAMGMGSRILPALVRRALHEVSEEIDRVLNKQERELLQWALETPDHMVQRHLDVLARAHREATE